MTAYESHIPPKGHFRLPQRKEPIVVLFIEDIQLLKRASLRIDIKKGHTFFDPWHQVNEPVAIFPRQTLTMILHAQFDGDCIVLHQYHVTVWAYLLDGHTPKGIDNLGTSTCIHTALILQQGWKTFAKIGDGLEADHRSRMLAALDIIDCNSTLWEALIR